VFQDEIEVDFFYRMLTFHRIDIRHVFGKMVVGTQAAQHALEAKLLYATQLPIDHTLSFLSELSIKSHEQMLFFHHSPVPLRSSLRCLDEVHVTRVSESIDSLGKNAYVYVDSIEIVKLLLREKDPQQCRIICANEATFTFASTARWKSIETISEGETWWGTYSTTLKQ
jgi:hypothetical protein